MISNVLLNFQKQKDDIKEKRQVSINPKVFFALCVLSKKFLKYMFARIGRTRSPTGYTGGFRKREKSNWKTLNLRVATQIDQVHFNLEGKHLNYAFFFKTRETVNYSKVNL